MLVPLGARADTSRIASMTERGTGVGRNARTERRLVIARSVSEAVIVVSGPPAGEHLRYHRDTAIPTVRPSLGLGNTDADGHQGRPGEGHLTPAASQHCARGAAQRRFASAAVRSIVVPFEEGQKNQTEQSPDWARRSTLNSRRP